MGLGTEGRSSRGLCQSSTRALVERGGKLGTTTLLVVVSHVIRRRIGVNFLFVWVCFHPLQRSFFENLCGKRASARHAFAGRMSKAVDLSTPGDKVSASKLIKVRYS